MLSRIRHNVTRKRIRFHTFHTFTRNFTVNHPIFDQKINNDGYFTENLVPQEATPNSNFLSNFLEFADEGQISLKKYIQAKPQFYDSWNYCQLDPKATYRGFPAKPPISSFQDILYFNENSTPTAGSFIEFVDPLTSEISFGTVVRNTQSKFNENYNKLIVLNVANELKQVSVSNIRLHFKNVVDEEFIANLLILENRFNEQFEPRLNLVQYMKSFINQSCTSSKALKQQFHTIYAQRARSHTLTSISAIEIIESLVFPETIVNDLNESYFNQCSVLFAVHLNLIDSTNFVVPFMDSTNSTNIIAKNCSNELVKNCTYLINSSTNSQAINKLLADFEIEEIFNNTNQFMNQLYQQQTSLHQKSFDDLNHYFNIWEGRHYKHVIDAIKFAIIHPHTKLVKGLHKLDLFKQFTPLTSEELFTILEDLKIYNNQKCPATDIYLSANIVGRPSLDKLAVNSHRDMTSNIDSNFLHSTKLQDKFPHLRQSKKYYADHVIYGIPYSTSLSKAKGTESYLAISLEKINARRYTINVHIPDVMSKLPPNSELFNAIIMKNFKALTNLINFSSINNFFDSKLLNQVKFASQDSKPFELEWIQVGDMSLETPSRQKYSDTTCLTLSLTYDTYESNPFAKLPEKVKFSFDSLGSVKIKNLSWKELDDCLEGKLESSPFRLFTRRPEPTGKAPVLSDHDCHNIRFIYSVMQSHFKVRNANGASILQDEMSSTNATDLEKEISYLHADTNHEQVVTSVKRNNYGDNYTKAKFFINELDKFVGNSTANYCYEHDIPIFSHSQSLSPHKHHEEVSISHNNILLPRYQASAYSQTLISRDAHGYVSLPASIIGKHFMASPFVGVYGEPNVLEGMDHGYVKMLDVVNDCESLINQLQILNHIQLLAFNEYCLDSQNQLDVIQRFSYLKSEGYNINGPFNAQTLTNQISNVTNADNVNQYLGAGMKRYWTLKMMEQRLLTSVQEATTTYECTITHIGEKIPELKIQLSSAYCEVLQLEMQVAINIDEHFTIGTTITCDKIIYLNPVLGHCILRQAYTL